MSQSSDNRRIRVLPDTVANQIAAGEVIERPAAVVKELLENSLDAGATRVEIEFKNGGKSYIRIEDNGHGMAPDEALMSLERHATSKLRAANDLQTITSLGFRGEALPSIASVSRFTLKSRTEGWEHGTEILINGGKMVHQRECGMAQGTRIEVANLFNSVPARRKFLKTDITESAHIVQLVRLHAVARPQVAFELIDNGRTIFKSPPCPSMRDRVMEIWGNQLPKDLIEFPSVEGRNGLKLSGLIGKPGIARSTRREMIALVNGRPVDSRTISYALIEGYHTFIPKGRYPIGFLFLEIDPAAVDVNIHPAKREIRFRDEGQVRQFILSTIQKTLEENNTASWKQPVQIETFSDEASQTAKAIIEARQKPQPIAPPPEIKKAFVPEPATNTPLETNETKPAPIAEPVKITIYDAEGTSSEHEVTPTPPPPVGEDIRLAWRLIGKLFDHYVLFETKAGLVTMNLRAAHERVWFEKLEGEFKAGSVVEQPLLIPIPLELEPLAAATLEEYLDFINNLGIRIAPFGRNFYRIEAHPDWLSDKDVEPFVKDLIFEVRDKGVNPNKTQLAHEFIARMASSRAIRLDDTLTDNEIKQLARDLLSCQNPLTCPRGKATFFETTRGELDKKFGK